MADANPYGPPVLTTPGTSSHDDLGVNDSTTDPLMITRYAQLGLRLLGVMFVVEGAAALIGSLTNGVMQTAAYVKAGYPVSFDPYSFGWGAQAIALVFVGAYLVVSGRWVLENVFLAPPATRDDRKADSGDV